jgi:ABC-2 type transport system permease protein
VISGFLQHFLLTLRLNFKSKQPLIYGYLVPIFFLIAFGTVFRSGKPPLLHEMSQLIAISVLGGACFGMPTALVAERERGWWRRYRLLPNALPPLVASTLLARFILVATAAVLQIALARLIYGTPLPAHPLHFLIAYGATAWAFLGLGLLIAALASDVPAVQALGQCVFLPLIMIGGMGVPLLVLPVWTQRLASFLPGRYAVDALGTGFTSDGHGALFRFNLLALLLIGAGAGLAGARLFRWDQTQRITRGARAYVLLALLPWIAVGAYSVHAGTWRALAPRPPEPGSQITDAQIDSIIYQNLPPDDGTVTPLAPANMDLGDDQRERLDALKVALDNWAPAHDPNPAQAIRSLLSVAAVADVAEDPMEGQIARTILDYLYAHFRQDRLEKGLAWAVIAPDEGTVRTSLPELKINGDFDEGTIRVRAAIYAVKFLGRVRGQLNN